MALGDYTPTAWANGTTPAINATNLGHIETKIDEIDAASAATSSTRIWSTSNDGNGGQPPAPKPLYNGDGRVGNFYNTFGATGYFTPNISGAVYAVIVFDSSGNFLGSAGDQLANVDLRNLWATCTQMMYWRTA